jgi:hypothetical protein
MSTVLNLNLTAPATPGFAGGYNYLEKSDDGWKMRLRNNGPSEATRKLICLFSDAPNFTRYLLECNSYISSTGFATTYIIGAQHPVAPALFVENLEINPYTGWSTAESIFDYAELTLYYKSLPYDPGSPATVREDSVEDITRVYNYPPPGIPIDAGPPPRYAPATFTLPILKITTCTNKLNTGALNFTYGGSTHTFDEKTILFCGANSKRTVLSGGLSKYNVTYTFIWSPVHNQYIDPKKVAAASPPASCVDAMTFASNGFVDYKDTDLTILGV